MRQELNLFKEWFLQKHLGLALSAEIEGMLSDYFDFLAKSAAKQPQAFMHRDYHSANLMVLPENKVGILDFQDAFIGPITYDAVSLLRDCYVAWPDETIINLALRYHEKLAALKIKVKEKEFLRWFDLMGMQRHLKALLTFSRKHHRDSNSSYLQHIPRTLNYLITVSARYKESMLFHEFLQKVIMESDLCGR